MKVVVAGPKAKDLGPITGGSGRDADCDWPNTVVVGPKAKDVGGTGAEAEIGPSFPCDAVGSKMAVGVGGGMRGVDPGWWMAGGTGAGVCDEDGVMPVDASAPTAFLYLSISLLSWLLPFSFSPSFRGWDEEGVLPVGASAPFTFPGIGRSFPLNCGKSETVVVVGSGCDVDGVMPVGATAPFIFSEIGWFSRDAGKSTIVIHVGGGMGGVGSGWWMAGGATRIGDRDKVGAMPGGASDSFAFPEIGANGPTTLFGVGVACGEDDVMPVGASAPSAISEID